MGNILTCNKLVNEDREQRDLKNINSSVMKRKIFIAIPFMGL